MHQDLEDFKAVPLKTLLAAAFDAGDSVLMAEAILAHPFSTNLKRPTIERLFRIAYANGLPAPSEADHLRALCDVLLTVEEDAHVAP